ncbi:hypothetical protein PR202_ga31549 [Eleusine coracana subsp. coracana]|uniref:Uncharacterized protein n=1 Tax=Eleusine coracana subsp. coracana TaxID=191504 RepID=A0AAV5DSD7_ELECO|nr:hypothetical protein PR202_ga31549 [Eleusine coracana subsp. coracana]
MEFLTLLVCTVATLITIHVVLYALHRYRPRTISGEFLPLPPGPSGLRLIKYALAFAGPFIRTRHRVLARLAEEYGPIAAFGTSTTRVLIVVSSPAAAREALAENDAGLADRFMPDSARALSHNSGSPLFLPSSDPLWKQYRVIINGHITSGRSLELSRHVRERHARQLAEHFKASSGRPVTVGVPMLGTVLNVVSSILFSRDDVVDLRVQGAHVLKDLLAELTAVSTKSNISDALPFLAPLDLFGLRRSFSRCLARLYKFLDEEFIEPRLASGETHHGDVLDVLLAQYAKSQLTRSDITKFFTDIFIAGSESSSLTVQWAMAQLLRHPEKMKKETMRLHPVAPLIPRVVVSNDVSLGGFPLPIGTGVAINLWAVGRDPASWPQPEEFVPERFLGDQALDFRGPDFAFKPFGAGRRVCPGMGLAARFVPLLLASILHKIEWSLPDGMAPQDVDLMDNYRTVLDLAAPLRAVPLSTD